MYEKKTHGEWLSLLEVSGPFLSEIVLDSYFPQGLDELDPGKKKLLRQAYEEWREAQDNVDPSFDELHKAWIDLVLKQGLELDEDNDEDVLKSSANFEGLSFVSFEHGVTVEPDYVVATGNDHPPRLLIQVFPAGTDLKAASKTDGWAASAVERLVQLCRASKVRLGLLTNGEQWLLIDVPEGGITSLASWYARLWGQEPTTLQAFVNLLGIRRFFLDSSQQLPALLDESLKHQDEVTDALGDQVKRAVEVLVQALDKADLDRDRELLKDVEPAELYEAGLTVMMRLVFLLCAEERGLLLLGDERYEAYYAVSSLRMQLREQAGQHSEEILSHRRDAWSRLLAIFRAVFGGVEHETLRMPALGGSLFDPDRFPFLEGREKGSNWRHDAAQPLPIDNRTVLLLLDAIQLFQGRTLSYLALDVEQIGYVYEGLLERTVIRANDVTLELEATKKSKKPWVTWGELEDARLSGEKAVKALLEERTGSSTSRINNDLNKVVSDANKEKLFVVCLGDQGLRDRLAPYYHFLRIDPWGYPRIYPKGSFMVATGSDRRETGTHYTPKSLTESIVKETLEPVVYVGPAEGANRKDWKLKTPEELLDLKICDLAMGSGAFLVQVCRWLSERLLESWVQAESQGKFVTSEGIVADNITNQELMAGDAEERSVAARRLTSERCLYGVDINPLAVELAKLSIWLITLAKGRPFGFLDHNLRHGDSLLGITNLEQLYYLDINVGRGSEKKLFAQKIEEAVKEAIELRLELRKRPILDIHDVEVMAHLDQKAREKLELPELVADALVGGSLKIGGKKLDSTLLSIDSGQAFEGLATGLELLKQRARIDLATDLPLGRKSRHPFHWCLQFPEVFLNEKYGFDAVIGNPPFLGDTSIRGALGKKYRDFLLAQIAKVKSGKSDLVVYFLLNAYKLISKNGCLGLIAIDSLSRGDSQDTGLRQVIDEGKGIIYSAATSLKWPGSASVVIHLIHIAKKWQGKRTLNGNHVSEISAGLTSQVSWYPVPLNSNLKMVFEGVQPNGEGFVVDDEVAQKLISDSIECKSILYPYLIAKRLNQNSPSSKPKWIINFWDWTYEQASKYPNCLNVLEDEVKPIRQRIDDKTGKYALEQKLVENWWTLKRPRPELFYRIGRGSLFSGKQKQTEDLPRLEKVIVFARGATKYPSFSLVENDKIYGDSLCIIASGSICLFAILSSDLHALWAWEYGARKTFDLRYIQDKVFETFPFPPDIFNDSNIGLSEIGECFLEKRHNYMVRHDKGMTKLYNDFHNREVTSDSIAELRDLQIKLNQAVLKAYGFDGLYLNHGFQEVGYLPQGQNTRFTICEPSREQLLYRLAMLNKERHEEEISNKTKKGSVTSIKQYDKRPLRDMALDKVAEPKPQMDFFGGEDE